MAEPLQNADSGTDMKLGRLADYAGSRIRLVLNRLLREFFESSRDHNVRGGTFSALELIHANPGVSQKEIASALDMDKSFVVLVIRKIEANGWAKRRKSKADGRRYELTCTRKGEKLLEELFKHVEQSEANVFNALTAREYKQLMALLAKVTRKS